MKSLKKLILSTFVLWLVVGCASEKKADNLLEKVKKEGVLIVATSPDWPPYEFIDSSKSGQEQYVGADIELAKYVAKELGVELKILAADFNTALASLTTKNADIVISGLGYKEDRLKAMDFSITYNPTDEKSSGWQGVMVRKEDVEKYKTFSDLNDVAIGAQVGSLQEGFVNEQIPKPNLVNIGSLSTGVVMLQNGKIDALAITSTTGQQYAEANGDIAMTQIKFISVEEDEYDGTVMGVQKNEPEMLDALNKIIAEFVKTGLYQEWEIEFKDYAEKIGA